MAFVEFIANILLPIIVIVICVYIAKWTNSDPEKLYNRVQFIFGGIVGGILLFVIWLTFYMHFNR